MQNDQKPQNPDFNDDLIDDPDDLDFDDDLDDLDDDDLDDETWDGDDDFEELDDSTSDELPPPKKKKSPLPTIIALSLVVALGGGGWFYMTSQSDTQTPSQNNAEITENAQENWPAPDQNAKNDAQTELAINAPPNQSPSLPMPSPMLSQIEEEVAPTGPDAQPQEQISAPEETLTPMPNQGDLSGDTNLVSLDGTQEGQSDPIAGEIFFKPAVQVTPIDDIITGEAFIPQAKEEIAITALAPPKTSLAEPVAPPQEKIELTPPPPVQEIETAPPPTSIEEPIRETQKDIALIEKMPPKAVSNSNIEVIAKEQLSEIYNDIGALETKISTSNALLADKISATERSINELSGSLARLENNLTKLIEMQSSKPAPVELEPVMQKIKQAAPVPVAEKTVKQQPVKIEKIIEPPVKKPAYTPPKVKKPVATAKKSPRKSTIWQLRSAQPGAALISEKGSNDYLSIRVGDKIPHIGRVSSIKLENNKWVVRAENGLIYQ